MARSAAALIIGNEILTGKIQETNMRDLASELFTLGIAFEHAVICRDDVDIIARHLSELRAQYDLVFTTGGVGPTHDDVTHKAVAKAFGRPIVRSPELAELITGLLADRVTEGHLQMADIPDGATLLQSEDVRWPTVIMQNVFVLPGLPKVFRLKLPALCKYLKGDETPFLSRALYTLCDEGELAAVLTELDNRHEDVSIGSYPVTDRPYRVKLTVDGRDRERIDDVVAALREAIPREKLVEAEDRLPAGAEIE
jgi:molybdenum cofactor synthesis domain-containing protein